MKKNFSTTGAFTKAILPTLFLTSLLGWTTESHTRFTATRMVCVSLNEDQQHYSGACYEVAQTDKFAEIVPSYHLHGTGNLLIHDLAVNARDEVVIAGTFSHQMFLDDLVQNSRGGQDLFYLVIDTYGEVLALERMGTDRDDQFFAAELDAFGRFVLQGGIPADKTARITPTFWILDGNGRIEEITSQDSLDYPPLVDETPTNPGDPSQYTVLDEEDDEIQEDPIG